MPYYTVLTKKIILRKFRSNFLMILVDVLLLRTRTRDEEKSRIIWIRIRNNGWPPPCSLHRIRPCLLCSPSIEYKMQGLYTTWVGLVFSLKTLVCTIPWYKMQGLYTTWEGLVFSHKTLVCTISWKALTV